MDIFLRITFQIKFKINEPCLRTSKSKSFLQVHTVALLNYAKHFILYFSSSSGNSIPIIHVILASEPLKLILNEKPTAVLVHIRPLKSV